jgi:hypothetical protein
VQRVDSSSNQASLHIMPSSFRANLNHPSAADNSTLTLPQQNMSHKSRTTGNQAKTGGLASNPTSRKQAKIQETLTSGLD